MRRPALVLILLATLAVVVAAPARAADPRHADPVIAARVNVAGLPVGGKTRAEALAAVREWFARPVRFRFHGRRWAVYPNQLRAYGLAAAAVDRALTAAPGTRVRLRVLVNRWRLRRYTAYLGRVFDRKARDSRLLLRHRRPFITRARRGRHVKQVAMRRAIRHALVTNLRGPLSLRVKWLRPHLTRGEFGAIVVIRRGSKRLYLYRNMHFVRRFGVATGRPRYPTPVGRFAIVTKQRHPWWYPPDTDWAAGAEPIPPGPGNPLGTRWMGLSAPGVGIHGTPDSASIGYSASHGCIRMRIPKAEWLFDRVSVGTTVFIIRA